MIQWHLAVCRLGCHTGRKSAYLLRIFGGGVLPALMQPARHVTAENALKCMLEQGWQ
jgi:hypothetical protein